MPKSIAIGKAFAYFFFFLLSSHYEGTHFHRYVNPIYMRHITSQCECGPSIEICQYTENYFPL